MSRLDDDGCGCVVGRRCGGEDGGLMEAAWLGAALLLLCRCRAER